MKKLKIFKKLLSVFSRLNPETRDGIPPNDHLQSLNLKQETVSTNPIILKDNITELKDSLNITINCDSYNQNCKNKKSSTLIAIILILAVIIILVILIK